jgi:hypothetical protein
MMPYPAWDPDRAPTPVDPLEPIATELSPPHEYYATKISDAEDQFDDVETTLSHLLRSPCTVSGQKTFGALLFESLVASELVHDGSRRIVEVGGGTGDLAADFLHALRVEKPELFEEVEYTILDLSPQLQEAQRRRLSQAGLEDKVTWIRTNAETMELAPGTVDLLLSNEAIGDFSTIRLESDTLEQDDSGFDPHQRAILDEVRALDLPLDDAPDSFFINLGALRFLGRVEEALSEGGCAYISEFGEPDAYPVPSTHLDHLEFSIHFGHLRHVGRSLGLHGELVDLPDWLKLRTAAFTMTATRSYFRAIQTMMRSFGIELPKQAITRPELEKLAAGKLSLETIGSLRFAPAQSRIMGLVPQEFKALLLSRHARETK